MGSISCKYVIGMIFGRSLLGALEMVRFELKQHGVSG